jgi:broad specificity phosphatase PhoE
MKLWLLRHGETVWNIEKRTQGWGDSELTEKGIKQIEDVSKIFKDKNIDLIIASDLKRTKISAEIISKKLKVDILYDWLLRERYAGTFEGVVKTKEIVAQTHSNKEFMKDNNVEYWEMVEARVKAFVENLFLLPCKHENVIVMGHTATNNRIYEFIKNNKEFNEKIEVEIIDTNIEGINEMFFGHKY